jgi:hypothetical protein
MGAPPIISESIIALSCLCICNWAYLHIHANTCPCVPLLMLCSLQCNLEKLCCCVHCNFIIYYPNTCIYMQIHANTDDIKVFQPTTPATWCERIHAYTAKYMRIHATTCKYNLIFCTYLHVFLVSICKYLCQYL